MKKRGSSHCEGAASTSENFEAALCGADLPFAKERHETIPKKELGIVLVLCHGLYHLGLQKVTDKRGETIIANIITLWGSHGNVQNKSFDILSRFCCCCCNMLYANGYVFIR